MILSFFPLIVALAGGWLKRICGGGWPVIPWGIPRLLYGLPWGAALVGLKGHAVLPWLGYLLGDVGNRLGHAQYQNMGFRAPGKSGASLDLIVRLFFGPDTYAGTPRSYWRCVFGLSVTGLGVTLAPGILYALYVDPVGGALIASSGALKPLGYMFGWRLWNSIPACSRNPTWTPNVYGEFMTGFTQWGAVGLLALGSL